MIDELKEARKLLDRKWPVAFVMHPSMEHSIMAKTDNLNPTKAFGTHFGVTIYSFTDVEPRDHIIVFYDREALIEYGKLRKKYGHKEAICRLIASRWEDGFSEIEPTEYLEED